MRPVNSNAQAIRERRTALVEMPMVWITGRDRSTGQPETMGLWTGADAENMTVTDMFTGTTANRQFLGAGSILGFGSVRFETGLNIRPVQIVLSSIDEAVRVAIRGYEPRGGTVQAWKRGYEPATMLPVGIEAWFKGYIDEIEIERPAPGGEGAISLTVVSQSRLLTIASDLKKSDAAQKRRSAGDDFRKYKAVAGETDVAWGTNDVRVR